MKKATILFIVTLVSLVMTSCTKHPAIIIPDLAFRAHASTGEGALWHPDRNTFFWVDIEGKTLYEYLPNERDCNSWNFNKMVSTVCQRQTQRC